jgi:hypothetical protein
MITDFEDLLSSAASNSTDALEKQLASLEKKGFEDPTEADPRFWTMKHLQNEDGNGRATIRFLPAPSGDAAPFVRYYTHFHQGPGGMVYNEKSRKSLGSNEQDPVWDHNGKLFADKSMSEDERKKVMIKRKEIFVSNILVIEDPVEPKNNGKVFLFQYGAQIMNKITAKMKPKFDDEPKVDVFNPVKGANFKLRIVQKSIGTRKVPNYEDSTFEDAVTPMADSNAKMKEIWTQEYSLKEFIDPANYKTYEELTELWDRTMTGTAKAAKPETAAEPKNKSSERRERDEIDDEIPFKGAKDETEESSVFDDDEDDFLAKLRSK